MFTFFILIILIIILIKIIFFKEEKFIDDKELNYHNNLSKNDIQNHNSLIIDTEYLKYENKKLLDYLENNHNSFNKIILLYTEAFNKSDILNKINDSEKLNIKVTEDNLSYFNIYFRKKT